MMMRTPNTEFHQLSHPANKFSFRNKRSQLTILFIIIFFKQLKSILQKGFIGDPQWSNIINGEAQLKQIQGMFQQKVKLELIFRASEHNFEVHSFHQHCDGCRDTLILCAISQGNIVGGYSPLPWDDRFNMHKTHAKTDTTQMAFLFNLNKNQKYELAKVSKNKAVIACQYLGPTFGDYDFSIGNKANKRYSSQSHFPTSYCLQKNPECTSQRFTGVKNENFQIDQWEVFHIIFSDEVLQRIQGKTLSRIQTFFTSYPHTTILSNENRLTNYFKGKFNALWEKSEEDDF